MSVQRSSAFENELLESIERCLKSPPDSYLNQRRPNLEDAIRLELEAGAKNTDDAIKSLEAKGYYSPRPRPWSLGIQQRGLGRMSHAVLDSYGDIVTAKISEQDALHIIRAVNMI